VDRVIQRTSSTIASARCGPLAICPRSLLKETCFAHGFVHEDVSAVFHDVEHDLAAYSGFAATVTIDQPGVYALVVSALDPEGVAVWTSDKRMIDVRD